MSLVQIKSLQAEYDITLSQYQELYQTFLQNIQSDEWDVINGKSYLGESGLNKMLVESPDDCQAECMNNGECSGATYNSTTQTCWTRKGSSGLTSGGPSMYAIIPSIQRNIAQLQVLNTRLLRLNAKIMDIAQKLTPDQIQQESIQHQTLIKSYDQLQREKVKIRKLADEYDTLIQANQEQELNATSQQSWLFLWMGIAVFVLWMTIKSLTASNNPDGTSNASIPVAVVALICGWYLFRYLLT
jgi:hypothetical protein